MIAGQFAGVMDSLRELAGEARLRSGALRDYVRQWPREREWVIRARRQVEAMPILERTAQELVAFANDIERASNASPTYETEAAVFMGLTAQIHEAAHQLHTGHVGDQGNDLVGEAAIRLLRASADVRRPSKSLLTFPPTGPELPPEMQLPDPDAPPRAGSVPWGLILGLGAAGVVAYAILRTKS
jgi:hypothetical protein